MNYLIFFITTPTATQANKLIMCIQMNPNYNNTPIVLYIDSNNNNIDTPEIALLTYTPVRLPIMGYEYLHLIDELRTQCQNSEYYENIQYIMGTIASLYGIYYFASRIVTSMCKKMF